MRKILGDFFADEEGTESWQPLPPMPPLEVSGTTRDWRPVGTAFKLKTRVLRP